MTGLLLHVIFLKMKKLMAVMHSLCIYLLLSPYMISHCHIRESNAMRRELPNVQILKVDVTSTANSASVCKSCPLWTFSSIHNCFDRTIAIDVSSEPLKSRMMVSHSHQNHAQFKRGCTASTHGKKICSAEYQPKISQNRSRLQSRITSKIKDVGGATELAENNSSLQRWLKAGPETARLIDEFGSSIGLYQIENDVQEHNDLNEASQINFLNHVLQLKKAFDEFDNLYLDNSFDLTSFCTNKLAIKDQTKSLYKIKVAGKPQFRLLEHSSCQ